MKTIMRHFCYFLNFTKYGTQASDYLQYLLLQSGYPSKHWAGISLLNFGDLTGIGLIWLKARMKRSSMGKEKTVFFYNQFTQRNL